MHGKRAIQDVIVSNIVNHPDPDYEEIEEDTMSTTTLDEAGSEPPPQVSSPKSEASDADSAAVVCTTTGCATTWSDISKLNFS